MAYKEFDPEVALMSRLRAKSRRLESKSAKLLNRAVRQLSQFDGREVNLMLDLIVLGLVCLVAPWLAKMSGYETPRKPFDLVGIAGIFFLLGASLSMVVDHVAWLKMLGVFILGLPYAVGVLLLAVGALWSTMEVFREPGHILGKHA